MAQTTYRPAAGQEINYKRTVETKTASFTLTAADSGKIFLIDGSASVVATLPSTAAGLEYTLIVKQLPGSGAGTAFSPAAADKIIGNGFTATDDKDAINSAASDALGDWITLVGDGVDGWYISSIKGTWAREA